LSSRQFAQFAQYSCGFREFGGWRRKSGSQGWFAGGFCSPGEELAAFRLALLEKQTPGGCPGVVQAAGQT